MYGGENPQQYNYTRKIESTLVQRRSVGVLKEAGTHIHVSTMPAKDVKLLLGSTFQTFDAK